MPLLKSELIGYKLMLTGQFGKDQTLFFFCTRKGDFLRSVFKVFQSGSHRILSHVPQSSPIPSIFLLSYTSLHSFRFFFVCNLTKKFASYFSQEKEKGLGADSFIGDSVETRQRNSTIACNVKKTPVE
jgi:hypothetical protein